MAKLFIALGFRDDLAAIIGPAARHEPASASSYPGDRQGERLRTLLVAGQIAMTLVLLIGAGLLIHSFVRLTSVPPGFESSGRDGVVQTVKVTLPEHLYDGPDRIHAFARDVLQAIPDRPISFEVFADEFDEMERQAHRIASWGGTVYVKIPVTNTRRESAVALIERLSGEGIRLNVTALLTLDQVRAVSAALAEGPSSCISVFAGRIADTGCDPVPIMRQALEIMAPHPHQELIWASPRELLNIVQADQIGCHIITVTHELLKKLPILGRDLAEYSLDTVKMFYNDAKTAGFTL